MGKLELVLETGNISIYSPKHDGESITEFERFLISNRSLSPLQLKISFDAIIAAIEKMKECGARENLFRLEGGRVKALPLYISNVRIDRSVGKLRLFCLRLSDKILILGNGGVTTARRYEDDPTMMAFVTDLRRIDKHIQKALNDAETDCEDFPALVKIIDSITFN